MIILLIHKRNPCVLARAVNQMSPNSLWTPIKFTVSSSIPNCSCPSLSQHHEYSKNRLLSLLQTRIYGRGGVEDTRLEAKAKDTKNSEAKAKDSLSEDRPSRGQGPRTQPQVFSKKESLQNSFLGDLQFIGVPRIFDWRRPKPQITWYDIIRNFQKKKFLWDKDIVGWKI